MARFAGRIWAACVLVVCFGAMVGRAAAGKRARKGPEPGSAGCLALGFTADLSCATCNELANAVPDEGGRAGRRCDVAAV